MENRIKMKWFIPLMLPRIMDNITTYWALRYPQLEEANPLGVWLFHSIGLVPGLALFTLLQAFILYAFLKWYPAGFWRRVLVTVITLPGIWAVYNNLAVLREIGAW